MVHIYLLEIDNEPVIIQQVQNKFFEIKNYLKNKNIQFKNIEIIDNQNIKFEINSDESNLKQDIFSDKESEINPYFPKFKTHQFNKYYQNNVLLELI